MSKFVLLHAVSAGAKRYWLLWCGSYSLPEALRPKLGSSAEQHVLLRMSLQQPLVHLFLKTMIQ